LLQESIKGLNIRENSIVIDATVDGGGHTREILKRLGPNGKLMGIDWDNDMILRLSDEFRDEKRAKFLNVNFSQLEKVARSLKIRPDAIFFDLGLSSLQLFSSGQGFSFSSSEPLLMTYSHDTHPNAREFLRRADEEMLQDIIWRYGEERYAKKIAQEIVRREKIQKIETSDELARIIAEVRPRTGRLHPATKTFQALRIYLNHELENLEKGLRGAWKILKPKGRILIISFHSLEDRIVKNFFKERHKEGRGVLLTKKPIRPSREEISINPHSRSAKLRIIEKK
jgi:16S rRNA (cytosine1402-N4)-methyltransferase